MTARRKIAGSDFYAERTRPAEYRTTADGTFLGRVDRRTRRCFPPVYVHHGTADEWPTLADAAADLAATR